MKRNFERRRCERFEIPDAYVRYQKRGIMKMISHLSDAKPLVNISKGGLCFKGNEKVKIGDKVTVYLYLSHGICWPIKGTVAWKDGSIYAGFLVGVKFCAYKKGHGYNSPETLDALRALEAFYLNVQSIFKQVA
jgi:hypothetical protein